MTNAVSYSGALYNGQICGGATELHSCIYRSVDGGKRAMTEAAASRPTCRAETPGPSDYWESNYSGGMQIVSAAEAVACVRSGQQIFVRGAALPALQEPERVTVSVLRGPIIGATPPRTGRLAWPVAGVITQYFWAGHTGVDLAAPYGTGIGASDDGVVSAAGWVAVGGLRVCVQHAGDLETCYYHTSAVYASVGQQVTRGQIIAAIGLTGVTTGPHVHWECKLGNRFVNCLDL